LSGQSAVEEKAVNPEAPLVLRLFGPFDAQVNGRPLPPLRSRRGQWLLALLILRHGREVERGWLAGTLWPDNPESQALYNLRRNLVSLRHALGVEAGRLRAPTPHTLSLDLQGAEADVAAFDAAITQGDAPSLRRAVALYRGPLLEGCGEEWAFPERQAREGAYLSALEQLADRALTDRDVPAAEGYLRQAAAVDPLRESAQRALMQALAVGGNDAAALLTYRELRLRLHRELNAEPDPETTVLFQQIRAEARRRAASPASGVGCEAPGDRGRGSGAAPAPSLRMPGAAWVRPARFTSPVAGDPLHEAIPHNLPLQLTRFVGREDQIAEVMDWLTTHRLVTLTGIGGCGKTRLALQVATHL